MLSAMSGSPAAHHAHHQRLHASAVGQQQQQQHYRNSSSPTSTCSDEDSEHSQPNDLSASRSSKHGSHATFPNYPPFYSPPHHGSSLGHHHASQQVSPYVATNECRIIEYRGARIAAFLSANKNPCEYLLCLPQAFELFLKHLVGGLHTVYTKLKRLDIVPIVCNVEQVRILRGLGAIQPGVNRCKLLSTKDFDVLFKDCTTARPGRPPKRSPVAGMVSPGPTSMAATVPQPQPNSVPYLGFPPAAKKPRYADDADFGLDLKGNQVNNSSRGDTTSSAATAAAMLAANGYSAAFPFLQHFTGNSNPTPQQQQQLVAAAAALGLPGLPANTRFPNSSPPPPGLGPLNGLRDRERDTNGGPNAESPSAGDFNPTAAYLWLLSQQQQQQNAAALNLSSRHERTNGANGGALTNGGSSLGHKSGPGGPGGHNGLAGHENGNDDESTDEDDDDDVDSHNSSRSDNPVTSTGFNGLALGVSGRPGTGESHGKTSNGPPVDNASSAAGSPPPTLPPMAQPTTGHRADRDRERERDSVAGVVVSGPAGPTAAPEQHCLETLLRNIEGLLAIAAHNARQQQSQLHIQKAELRAELAGQIERERELREHIEKQLNEEQKIRLLYQKRFKKERRFRRKLEQELHLSQPSSQLSPLQHKQQLQKETPLPSARDGDRHDPKPPAKASPPASPEMQQEAENSVEADLD
ncbi:Dachshund -like protein 1 [Halotydeus destructor]|nr:Dachshund -like protein 1 [Halotydeus destructor]